MLKIKKKNWPVVFAATRKRNAWRNPGAIKILLPLWAGILKKHSFIEIRVTRSEFDEKKLEKAAMTQIFFRYFTELSEKIMQPRNLY